MKSWTFDELRDLAPAYVMDTLSADEREAFEAAMATSPELATDVAEYRQVVERLATEQALAPSPSVRARFLERIAADKTVPLAPPAAAPVSAPPAIPVAVPVSPAAPRVDASSSRSSGAQSRAAARWWASGALAVALAASLVLLVNRNNELQSLRDTLAQRDSVIKLRDQKLASREDQLETVLEAEKQLVVVHLTSQTPGGPGIQFFWNVKQGRGLLHAFKLPPASRGHAYQMWFIKDGKPVPVNVFNSDPDGHGLVADIPLPKDLKGVTLMAVTLEPEGGSTQPTSVPFMTGALAAQ